MTDPKEKAPNSAEKRDTLRLRATRLNWHRAPAAGVEEAAAGQADAHSPEAVSPEALAATRLTVVTRLPFVPYTLEAYARRLKWRQRMPIVLCVALLGALALWLLVHHLRGTTRIDENSAAPLAAPRELATVDAEPLSAEKPKDVPLVPAPAALLPPRESPSALPSIGGQQLELKATTPELKPSSKPRQPPPAPSPSPDDDWL